jgi:hypothetical protein
MSERNQAIEECAKELLRLADKSRKEHVRLARMFGKQDQRAKDAEHKFAVLADTSRDLLKLKNRIYG